MLFSKFIFNSFVCLLPCKNVHFKLTVLKIDNIKNVQTSCMVASACKTLAGEKESRNVKVIILIACLFRNRAQN